MMEWLSDFYNAINALEVTPVSAIFKLCLSMVLGSLIGLERKRKGQIAGLRTFALISMGATLAMLLSIYVPQEYLGLKNGDPGRIAAQVVSGIGFLGAGAIIQMRGSVRGLTTAAGIWMVATLGMAVGVGLYLVAIVATGFVLFILLWLEQFERRVHVGWQTRIISLRVSEIVEDVEEYRECLAKHHVHLNNVYLEYDYEKPETQFNLIVLVKDTIDYVALFAEMRTLHPTISVSVANQMPS